MAWETVPQAAVLGVINKIAGPLWHSHWRANEGCLGELRKGTHLGCPTVQKWQFLCWPRESIETNVQFASIDLCARGGAFSHQAAAVIAAAALIYSEALLLSSLQALSPLSATPLAVGHALTMLFIRWESIPLCLPFIDRLQST